MGLVQPPTSLLRKYAVGTTVGPWNNRLEQMNYEEPAAYIQGGYTISPVIS